MKMRLLCALIVQAGKVLKNLPLHQKCQAFSRTMAGRDGLHCGKRTQIGLNKISLMGNGCGCFNNIVHKLCFSCESVCKFVSQFTIVSFNMPLRGELVNEEILTKKSDDFIDWYN